MAWAREGESGEAAVVMEAGDMPLMSPIRPPADKLVIEMSTREVLIANVSVSLLSRFCKKIFEFAGDEVLKSASKEIYFNNFDRQLE